MKKVTLMMCGIFMSFFLFAQEKDNSHKRQHELGITSQNFETIGFMYRVGDSTKLWRIHPTILTYSLDQTSSTHSSNSKGMNYSLHIGREYRKVINDLIELKLGVDIGGSYAKQKSFSHYENFNETESVNKLYQVDIRCVLGFNLVFSERVVLGAEVLPMVLYQQTESSSSSSEKNIDEKIGFNLNSSTALLSLSYRL